MPAVLDKQKILEASIRAFAKHGFRKASLTDITRPLGVAKTALYHHFPGGKRELIHAVIRSETDLILREMQNAIAAEADPRRQLRAMILAKLTHFHHLKELLDVSQDVGEELAEIYYSQERAYHDAEEHLILNILQYGCEKGYFSITDPHATALSICVVGHYFERSFVFEKSPDDMEKTVDDLLNILFYGIVDHRLYGKRGNAL